MPLFHVFLKSYSITALGLILLGIVGNLEMTFHEKESAHDLWNLKSFIKGSKHLQTLAVMVQDLTAFIQITY